MTEETEMQTDANVPDVPTVDKDGIPLYTGSGVSDCCWVLPGQPHNLSCEQVTPEQFHALLARQSAR